MNQISQRQLKILFATADRRFYESVKHLFDGLQEKRGIIEQVKSSRSALRALKTGDYDVCFIDNNFGKGTGLALLHKAILAGCRTPLILLTDEEAEKLRIEAMRTGAAYCLVKTSIDAPLLEKVIGYAVERVGSLTELRESVIKFRNLVETLPVMIYVAEPHPPYPPIYISPAFEAFGYPLEEWNSCVDFWMRLLHPEDSERILSETAAMMNSGQETDLEYRVIAKDGTTHWVHDRGHFVRDEHGKPVCWQGVILDISKRKEAERSLRNSEAQFKSAFEDAAVGMAISSLDGRWMQVNQQLCDMLGYSREELINHRFAEVTHPDDIQGDFDSRVKFLSGDVRIFQREKRFIHKKGHYIWGYLNVSMVCDEYDKPSHFIAEIQDITVHKTVLEALRESEARYRDIFENANDLIYVHDLEGNYLSINKATERVIGYTPEEALKLNMRQVVAPEHFDYSRRRLADKLAGEAQQTVYETDCITKDGRRVTLEVNSSAIYKDGEVVAVQGIARDVSERRRTEQVLKEREEQYRELFENANDIIYTRDMNGKFTSLNRAGEILTGYTREEFLQMNIGQILAPEYIEKARQMVAKNNTDEPLPTYELAIISKQGHPIPLELSTRLIMQDGKAVGIQGIARDITERQRAEQALKDSEQKYRLLGEGIMHQIWTAKPDGELDYINWRTLEYFGQTYSETLGDGWQTMVHPDDLAQSIENWSHSLATGDDYETEFRLRRHDGKYFWFQARATAGRDAEGKIINWFGTNTDIDDRKKAEAKLQYFAGHDTLTNLPNRARFMSYLTRAVKRSEHNPTFRFAVLFLDLDRFKIINDSLGHSIGDKLLLEIAERLEECVRPNDIVARLGGDEFTVLLTRISEPADAVRVAERFLEKLSAPFKLDNYEVFTSASIGIIISDDVKRQPEDFLRDADTAMYRAKSAGKSRYEIFDREMHIRNMNLLQMENDLRKAIEQNEFRVFYQPIVELATGRILEFEALIRWQHPQHGMVAPNDFIGIAEETGLIIPIGRWILEESCRQTAEWQKHFPQYNRLSISVNLSAKQLLHPNIMAQVKEILEKTAFDPLCLKLEVTESMVMENSDKALTVISELNKLGISLSTDDFGTGYSSLSYLHRFPFDRLKVDRSFVSKMDSDQKSEAIVRTILLLAQNLNIEVVAEGIETETQLRTLRQNGCRTGQGYLFSRPVTAEAAAELLQNGLPNIAAALPYNFGEMENHQMLKLDKVQ